MLYNHLLWSLKWSCSTVKVSKQHRTLDSSNNLIVHTEIFTIWNFHCTVSKQDFHNYIFADHLFQGFMVSVQYSCHVAAKDMPHYLSVKGQILCWKSFHIEYQVKEIRVSAKVITHSWGNKVTLATAKILSCHYRTNWNCSISLIEWRLKEGNFAGGKCL